MQREFWSLPGLKRSTVVGKGRWQHFKGAVCLDGAAFGVKSREE
jgi:hypothetical protein